MNHPSLMSLIRPLPFIVLIVLGACNVLPAINKPTNLYTLTPKTTFDGQLPKVDWQLLVEYPGATAGIDTSRIALQRSPLTFEYYANASWTDNAPAMVQNLLIESFEATHSILAVGREASGLRPDYLLKTDLREFEAIYNGSDPVPEILVRVNAKLVKMPDRRIIAAQTFERRVKSSGTGIKDVVAAFDSALDKVLKEVVTFTLTSGTASGS